MKPIQNHVREGLAASDPQDAATSHFVPLGHVVEGIVRRAHEKRSKKTAHDGTHDRHTVSAASAALAGSSRGGDHERHGFCSPNKARLAVPGARSPVAD